MPRKIFELGFAHGFTAVRTVGTKAGLAAADSWVDYLVTPDDDPMNSIKRLFAVLMLSGSLWATTTITGHIQNLGTGNITSGAYVRFWLRGCGGNQPTVTGNGIIWPSQGGVFYFDIPANSSGLVSGTIYSTRDSTGLLGGDISCDGSLLAVWYGMQVYQNGKGGPETPIHAKSGATLDITSVTPITTNPVVASPTGDSTYARLDAGNQPFQGSLTPNSNGVLNLGAGANRWNFIGNTLNLTGAATLSGATTTLNLNGVQYAAQFSGATADVKINAAITALSGNGGVVDARSLTGAQTIAATIAIPTHVTVLLGVANYTCTVSMGGQHCFNLTGSAARLIGSGMGDSSGFGAGADPSSSAALGTTSLVCSGCSSTTDMIHVASTSRGTIGAAIVGNPEVASVWINMGVVGQSALNSITTSNASYHDIAIFNCAKDCVWIQGSLSGEVFDNYYTVLERVWAQPAASNNTGAAFHLDATNSEVSWLFLRSCRGSGNISNGGGEYGVLAETANTATTSMNHITIQNDYFGNVATSGANGGWGIKLKAPNNYPTVFVGTIDDITISNTLVERLFSAAVGTAIGGTDGTDTPNGVGIGAIALLGTNTSANWATTIDRANLGSYHIELADGTQRQGGGAMRISGSISGANGTGLRTEETHLATANNQNMFGIYSVPSFNVGVSTGGQAIAIEGDGASMVKTGGGSLANAYAGYFTNPTVGTANHGLYAEFPIFQVGIDNNGSGFKHKRVAGCATAASLASTCTVTITWTNAFADANYTASCTGDVITSGVPINGGLTAKVAAAITFQTVAGTAAVAQYTNIDCIAVHD